MNEYDSAESCDRTQYIVELSLKHLSIFDRKRQQKYQLAEGKNTLTKIKVLTVPEHNTVYHSKTQARQKESSSRISAAFLFYTNNLRNSNVEEEDRRV